MISEDRVNSIVKLLQEVAPRARVILFGSQARGTAKQESDIDLLVIEQSVTSEHEEMVRLSDALRPLRIPVDIIVTTLKTFEEWKNIPGTILYDAFHEGVILCDG